MSVCVCARVREKGALRIECIIRGCEGRERGLKDQGVLNDLTKGGRWFKVPLRYCGSGPTDLQVHGLVWPTVTRDLV